MLSPSQIARTLDIDAVLDLVEAAEAALHARRDDLASPAAPAETLARTLALLDRTASIRKTLAQIHVTLSRPGAPGPSGSPGPDQPPLDPGIAQYQLALDQYNELRAENDALAREMQQTLAPPAPSAHASPQDPSAAPLAPPAPPQFNLEPLETLEPLEPLGQLDPFPPMRPLAPLRPSAPDSGPFTIRPIPPLPRRGLRGPVGGATVPAVPTISFLGPRSCRVLPWHKLPEIAQQTHTRAQELTKSSQNSPQSPDRTDGPDRIAGDSPILPSSDRPRPLHPGDTPIPFDTS